MALTIVIAQWLLHTHEADVEKHSPGTVCGYCIQASNLGSSHVAHQPPLLAVTVVRIEIVRWFETAFIAQSRLPIQARAPPVLL